MGFRDVATRAGLRGADRHFVRIVLRNKDDLRVGSLLADAPGGFEAVEIWHRDIQKNDVGDQGRGFLDCVAAIDSFAADSPAWMRFEERAQRLSQDLAVVGDEYFHRILTISCQCIGRQV